MAGVSKHVSLKSHEKWSSFESQKNKRRLWLVDAQADTVSMALHKDKKCHNIQKLGANMKLKKTDGG